MSPSRARAITLHVESAKRLLADLEVQAVTARDAMDRDGGAEFAAALEERDRILTQLTDVVDAIAHERGATPDVGGQLHGHVDGHVDAGPIFAEVARVAAAALESQQALMAHATREWNRLAAALHNTNRPDSVASHYAASGGGRQVTLSVTG